MWGMIRIKVFRASQVFYFIMVMALAAMVLFLSCRLLFGKPVGLGTSFYPEYGDKANKIANQGTYESIFIKGYPILSSVEKSKGAAFFTGMWEWIKGKNLKDPKTIIMYQMPFLNSVKLANEEVPEPEPEDDNLDQVIEVSRGPLDRELIREGEEEIYFRYESEIDDEIKIQIAQIKDDLKPIELTNEGYQILIYHTHSREAYRQDPQNPYKAVEAFRSDDFDYTVINVGRILAENLRSKGIATLHDKTEHEKNDFNSSYSRSLTTMKERMKEYSSIKITIDIHRNAYKDNTKSPNDEVVIIDGKRVAKVMVCIGTGEGNFGGYAQKPNWQENYKFGLKLTNTLNEKYPNLAKPVYITKNRYNQHVSTRSILIEVGSTLTTMAEAERAAQYLAEAISKIVE